MDELGYMLEYGVDLLKKRGISYWLDCGTLLGIIRDQSLIEWEKDIDIGVLKNQLEESDIWYIVNKVKNDGYDVNVYESCISICKNDIVLDIKLYEQKEDLLFEKKKIPKNLISSAICFTVHCFSSKYGSSRKGLNFPHSIVIMSIQTLSKLIPKFISSILIRPFKYLCENYLTVDISEAVPCKYFETFEEIVFFGKSYAIPSMKEDYLAFRYGGNWRVPNKNWVTERDDGGYLYFQNKK